MHSRSQIILNWICHQFGTNDCRYAAFLATQIRSCHGHQVLFLDKIPLSQRKTTNITIPIYHIKLLDRSRRQRYYYSTATPSTTTKQDEEETEILSKQIRKHDSTRISLDELTVDELEEQQHYGYDKQNKATTNGTNEDHGSYDRNQSNEKTNGIHAETSTKNKPSGCPFASQKLKAKPFDAIPGPRPSLPFIGTNWIYFPFIGHYKSMKLHEANIDKYHRYGPIMKEEYQRGYPTVTIFDPSDIKEVFMRESTCPSRPVLPYVIKHRQSDPSRYPNVGLANMEGPEWLELRSRLAPLLLSRELKQRHISTQNRVSSRLVNYIKSLLPAIDNNNVSTTCHHKQNQKQQNSGIVDNIQEVFYRFSMESIMNLCINQELGCLKATGSDSFNAVSSDGENIFQAAMNFFEAQHRLYYGLGFWKYFDTKPYRQLCDSQNAIHDIASKYIDVALVHLKQKRDSRLRMNKGGKVSQSSEEHESLLETLYCTNQFNDLEIKSTIVDFVAGGIYTVANTLTMVLFLLASNPTVQEQLYQEICQVFKDENEIGSDINIDMMKLEQLKFLKLCLKESYRLLPTIPGVARTLQQDMVLSNYLVPKNTLVFCNFMVTCRLPQYFSEPNDYNPNRWDRSSKLKSDLAFCLLPFGHGVRKCIGHNFAELEIYVALAKLIRSFKIKTINGEDAKSLNLCYKFIVVPEKPVTLEFIPREKNTS